MSDNGDRPSGEPTALRAIRLLVDLVRAVAWPAVALFVLLIYGNTIVDILRTREFEVPGMVKVGQQVRYLEEQATDSLEALRADLRVLEDRIGDDRANGPDEAQAAKSADVEKIQDRLDRTIKNIRSEADRIVTQATVQAAARSGYRLPDAADPSALALAPAVEAAKRLEMAGFEFLADRQVDRAIDAFARAEEAYPGYHNVYEIRKLLARGRAALKDPKDDAAWREVNRAILENYSWGMPPGIKARLRR